MCVCVCGDGGGYFHPGLHQDVLTRQQDSDRGGSPEDTSDLSFYEQELTEGRAPKNIQTEENTATLGPLKGAIYIEVVIIIIITERVLRVCTHTLILQSVHTHTLSKGSDPGPV